MVPAATPRSRGRSAAARTPSRNTGIAPSPVASAVPVAARSRISMETTASGPRVRDQSRTVDTTSASPPRTYRLPLGIRRSRAIEIDRDCEQERSRPDDEPEECHVLLAKPRSRSGRSEVAAASGCRPRRRRRVAFPLRSGTGVCSITNRSPPSRTYECRVIEVAPRAALNPRRDRLVDAAVEPDEVPAGAERPPAKVDGRQRPRLQIANRHFPARVPHFSARSRASRAARRRGHERRSQRRTSSNDETSAGEPHRSSLFA